MKYFVVWLPMLDEEKSRVFRPEHLAYLQQQRGQGRIFANGRFTDGWGGMVIYQAESQEEVAAWAENDPYVIHGARSYEIHEWDMVR
ncbi:YciI family protein [Paenibacillus filicis]|uniref:YciI family protein n=1 Tax=Paenibacillus gyeongsangnamensis TaxID=3388067 RepID=A0ABT4Q544_9BACL|nr:YciI family protein [Paenibacillus filicis]MCZ8511983.1 YciI family protein [Paenibacillus filicis]